MPTLFLTGASGGLGSDVTQWFLNRHWNVVAVDSHFPGEFLKTFSSHKKNLFVKTADVTSERSMKTVVTAAEKKFGPPDAALLGVGGIHKWMNVEKLSLREFRRVIDLNLTSAFVTSRALLPSMERNPTGGVLVFMGAQPALAAEATKSGYAIAKAGVVKLAETIALEKKGTLIRANVIVPSILRTAANLEWASGGEEKNWVAPVDVAAMVAHLASKHGRSITGAVIKMFGGV